MFGMLQFKKATLFPRYNYTHSQKETSKAKKISIFNLHMMGMFPSIIGYHFITVALYCIQIFLYAQS